MIEVNNLTRTYGKKQSVFQALRGVSFQIPTGTTAAIVGKSGSGKSTLMHLMGGLDRPTEGDILIDGHSLSKMKRRVADRFRSRDLGFVFQSFFIEGGQTCYQNVVLPLEINQVRRSRRKALVNEALEQVGLTDKLKAKAGTLSGGQKQRLAIARAIVHSPKIIMADEPTGNLDSTTGEKIIRLLFGLNRRLGCTLIIVTHDADLAAKCDYQIEVKDGMVVRMRGPRNGATPANQPLVPAAKPPVQPMAARPARISAQPYRAMAGSAPVANHPNAVQSAGSVQPRSNPITKGRVQ